MKYLILMLSTITLFACNSANNASNLMENPMRADGSIDSTKLAIFDFEVDEYDFGKVIDGEKVSYSFNFKNTGKAPLIISNVATSCGCTVPTYSSDPVLPGENGKIDVVFDSENKLGVVAKAITVTSNCIPNTRVLYIRGEVNPKNN